MVEVIVRKGQRGLVVRRMSMPIVHDTRNAVVMPSLYRQSVKGNRNSHWWRLVSENGIVNGRLYWTHSAIIGWPARFQDEASTWRNVS